MARIRTIKPEFPQSESMGRVSRDARLAFILLWTIADDDGRLRGNSRMLASLLFPYDADAPSLIDGWLNELASQNCIVRYKARCETDTVESEYIEIHKWLAHQKIDHPTKSKIPSRKIAKPRERVAKTSVGLEGTKGPKDQGPKDRTGTKDQGAADDLCPVFESFWKAFPSGRKQGKEAAQKAFSLALKKTTAETIIRSAAEYAASPVGRGEYVKGPVPWLNQGCWDDDRAAWHRSNGKQSNPDDPSGNMGVAQRYLETLRNDEE